MSKYVSRFASFTKEGWEYVEQIIDREKLKDYLVKLSPLERELLASVLSRSVDMYVCLMNSEEAMLTELDEQEKAK